MFKAALAWDDFAAPLFCRVAEASGAKTRHVAGGKCQGRTNESGTESKYRGSSNESVTETADAYEIHVSAAGVRPQDLQASVDHASVLRVVGESAIASVDCSIRLPHDADLDRIALSVRDGLVRIVIHKRQPRQLHVRPTA